jgi:3-oxosteroid 1-dehydrogenase
MLQISLRERIPIWTETPVRDLIVEEGRVVGVLADHNGKPLRIRAKDGVLINAGGFSRNQEMRDRYQRKPISAQWTSVDPGHTGEMQQAAMRLGAAVAQMEQAVWNITSLQFDGSLPPGVPVVDKIAYPFPQPYDISKPHGIMVDQAGQRFFDEAVSYIEQVNKMYDRHETVPAVPSWQIMDSRHRSQYFWAGSPPGVTPKAWIESGYMKKANTLEELALMCNIDPAVLQATISRFNGFCNTGVDTDFHRGENGYARFVGDPTYKPNPSIGSIEKPPFYAVAMFPHDVGTYGGLLTDEFARVLRADGSVIEGLYATGTSAASVMGKTYPGAGASVGPSFLWGWVAACHACGRPQ